MANWYDFSNQANWGNAATATYDPMNNRTYGSPEEAAQNGWDATALWQYGKDPMLQQRAALLNQVWGAQSAGNNPAQAAQDAMQTALTTGTAIGGGPNMGTSMASAPVPAMTLPQAQTAMYGGLAPTDTPAPQAPQSNLLDFYNESRGIGFNEGLSPAGMGSAAPYMPTIIDDTAGRPVPGYGGGYSQPPTQNMGAPFTSDMGMSTGMAPQQMAPQQTNFGLPSTPLDISNPWNPMAISAGIAGSSRDPLAVTASTGAGRNPLANGRFGMDNPNVQAQANAITNQVSNNFTRNIAPALRYGASAAGGYGGSRQGVLEANAVRDMNQTLGNSLAGLYGNAYQFDTNAALQNQVMQNQFGLNMGNLSLSSDTADRNYGLGMGGLALNQNTANQNFYGQQRGQDMQQMQLGANLLQQSNQGMSGIGQGLYGIGTQYQNAPWNTINQTVGGYSPFTGLGGTTTQGQNTGGGVQGLLGGLLGGAQLGKNMGWY